MNRHVSISSRLRDRRIKIGMDTRMNAADRIDKLEAALTEVTQCFEAAYIEGLSEALAASTDERLKDMVQQRLLFANATAIEALEKPNQQ